MFSVSQVLVPRSFRRHRAVATVDAADIRGLGTARLLCVAERSSVSVRTSQPKLPPFTTTRVLHLATAPPTRSRNQSPPVCARVFRYAVRETSRAIAQMKPVSSRATAVATFGLALPRATNRRKRAVSRSCAVHAMSQTTFGSASCR